MISFFFNTNFRDCTFVLSLARTDTNIPEEYRGLEKMNATSFISILRIGIELLSSA
jgi:hypothetical protein